MKAKEFAALGKALAASLPRSVVRGPMTLLLPAGEILRGLHFEGSSFDADSFYVWWFFMPLFVPTEIVHFSFGNRVRIRGGADRWNRADPDFMTELNTAVQKDALPVLLRVETPVGAIDVLQERLDRSNGKSSWAREALAYSLALVGDYPGAKENLEQLKPSLDPKVAWQKEKADRADILIAKIAQGPEAVAAQLQEWRSQTLHNLKLEDLASTSTAK